MIWSDFEFVIHLVCIIKTRILDIIWPCLLIIMIMTWLFEGILFICALVVSFAAGANKQYTLKKSCYSLIMFFHSFIAMAFFRVHCFFTVYSSVNAAWSSCRRKVHPKGVKSKTFPLGYVTNLSGVLVRCSRVEPKVQGSSPAEFYIPSFFFFFSVFSVVVFYKYIAK